MKCPRGRAEEEALKAIRPTRLQLSILSRFASMIKARLEPCLASELQGREWIVEPVGSFAKGTLLRDKWELDVFVLIDASREWIREHAEGVLRRCLAGLPVVAKYSEHPYLTVNLMGLQADIVPAPLLKEPRGAMGVERTPFHKRWVLERLRRNECIADDIRLLKSFLKGIGVYGAETRVGGFSGYLSEVLVIVSGGFLTLLEEASRWRPPVYFDPEGWGSEEKLRRRYPEAPLLVPDPVDPERNVAAAVTRRRLAEFVLAARLYLEEPSTFYFHLLQPPVEAKPLPGVLVEFRGDFSSTPPDSLWGRLKRVAESLFRGLRRHGFQATHYSIYTDEAATAMIYIGLLSTRLTAAEAVEGPEAWGAHGRVKGFLSARARQGALVWVTQEGVIAGVRPRRLLTAREVVVAELPRLPGLPGASLVKVEECPGGEACREAESLADPTPAWLRLALARR